MPQLLTQALADMLDEQTQPVWLGPCAEGWNGGVTQSMLQRYCSCRERFRIKYVMGLEPPQRFSKAMEYGNLWHAAEEGLASGVPGAWSSKVDDYGSKLMQKYPMDREQVHLWWRICLMQFSEYVDHWASHPDVVDRVPLMQEQVFDVRYRLPSGRVARLRGKFDSVDLIPSASGIYIQENKSKSEVDELDLRRTLSFDIQTLLYHVALQHFDWRQVMDITSEKSVVSIWKSMPDICGVRYNVIRRPLSGGEGTIRQHKAKTTKETRSKKDGRILKPSVHTPAETTEEFVERLRSDYINAEPEKWFMRLQSRVSEADVLAYRKQFLDPILENLADDAEWFISCLTDGRDHWNYMDRAEKFPHHQQRHFRWPFGVWDAIGGGTTEYDHMLATGSAGGLCRVDKLFPELEEST
jgi:hypothetical protein